jgi:L,D-transpeptidase catalytic domain
VRRAGACGLAVLVLVAAGASAASPVKRAGVVSGVPPYTSVLIEAPTFLRDRPHGRVIAHLGTHTSFHSPRILGVVGRRGSWLRVVATDLPNGRTGWIATDHALQYAVDWRLDVSVARRQAVVRRAGRIVRRVTISVGGVATPTPTGRFAVTDKLRFTDASPYGWGALALSAHQPAIAQGWGGGDRIAFHGTTDPGSVGQAVSHGCLRTATPDIRWLVKHVPLGTPVFVRE